MTVFVAIGASGAKGLKDMRALLSALSHPVNAILLLVLHRLPAAPSDLQGILGRASPIPVVLAEQGERLVPGICYIGGPAAHLSLISKQFSGLTAHVPEQHRNRTVDFLFRSVALCAGRKAIGVILSGGSDDGSEGLAAIQAAGGAALVLATGESSPSCESSMPMQARAYSENLKYVGTIDELAAEIMRRMRFSSLSRSQRKQGRAYCDALGENAIQRPVRIGNPGGWGVAEALGGTSNWR
jgi:two-component system chemotaxis response regulator CheB